MLREPVADAEKLHEQDRLADEFTANEKERITIQKIFMNMGKSRKIAVTDYIGYIMDIEQGSNIVHYLAWVFLIASILVTVLVTPVLGIWLIIASVAFSIITYYKYKAKIENYFKCINVIFNDVVSDCCNIWKINTFKCIKTFCLDFLFLWLCFYI